MEIQGILCLQALGVLFSEFCNSDRRKCLASSFLVSSLVEEDTEGVASLQEEEESNFV